MCTEMLAGSASQAWNNAMGDHRFGVQVIRGSSPGGTPFLAVSSVSNEIG